MEELKKQFTKKKVTYTQVLKNDKWYVYACKPEYAKKDSYYEVFLRKERQKSIYDNGWKKVDGETVEVYPSDEDFGEWAWCVNTLERAMSYSGSEGLLV